MKKFLTAVLILTALAASAQTKKTVPVPTQKQEPAQVPSAQPPNPLIEHFYKRYQLASRWNDLAAQKDALIDLIVETGNDSLAYTLASVYFENRQYASAVLITKDLLVRNPKNVNLLQMSASGFEGLGLSDKAVINYETIYLLTNNVSVLYKMATLQFDLKRFAECQTNVDILLTKTEDVNKLKVSVTGPDNKVKEFPLKVALLNLKGLLAQQAGDKVLAKKSFEDALALAPEFTLAKDNLAKLK